MGKTNQRLMTFDDRTEANIKTLLPKAQAAARQFMAAVSEAMKTEGVTVKIISGTRTFAEQDKLYAQGRTVPGRKVTNARGGYSNHNFGIAWDIGLFTKDGRYLEDSPLYRTCGSIGRKLGLGWGGDWKSIQDEPHFEVRPAWAATMSESAMLEEMRERVAAGKDIL